MELTLRKKYDPLQLIQYALILLMSLNFANLYFYIIFLAFFICLASNIRSLRVDIVSLLIFALSVCYILFYPPTRDTITTSIKQFAYPMCYIIGLNLANSNRMINQENKGTDERIRLSIILVSLGTFLHYLLNATVNIGSLLRNTKDFWTGEVASATDQALLAVMALGVFSVWLVGERPVWVKILSLAGLVVVFAYNFVLAGRTILLLEAITIIVAFFFMQRNMYAEGRIKSYLFLALIFVGVLVLFLNNAWGLRDWILNSNLSARFDTQEALTDIRLERKFLYLGRFFEFPFGGGHLRTAVGGHAHELYLDAFSDVGILGYVLVIAIVVSSTVSVFRLFRDKSLNVETRSLVLCVFLGINIVFFLEPILQGEPWLFCIFCFLCGVMRSERLTLKYN